jgi:hypothetical protein
VLKKKGCPQAITIWPRMTKRNWFEEATKILIHAPEIVHRDAIIRHTLRPPRFSPKILIAIKLKGMKEMEKTNEHIEIIRLSTWNRPEVRVVIGIKAT